MRVCSFLGCSGRSSHPSSAYQGDGWKSLQLEYISPRTMAAFATLVVQQIMGHFDATFLALDYCDNDDFIPWHNTPLYFSNSFKKKQLKMVHT